MSNNRITRLARLALIPLVAVGLSACAQSFNAQVSRFSAELPAPQGQTFAVVASDPAMKGGLEFAQYAKLVDAQMVRLGYAQGDPESAQLIVKFDYGVDNGRQRVRTTGFGDPFWSPWYGYRGWGYWGGAMGYYPRSAWGWGWYDPWFDNGTDSYIVYTSKISLTVNRKDDGKRLFEGRAEAVSTSNRLQYLVPNLIQAMFTNFPGNNGETVRISIAPEKKKG